MINKNLQHELSNLLDSKPTDSVSLLNDCRAISKSYGLGYGYIISRLATLTSERKSNATKEF